MGRPVLLHVKFEDLSDCFGREGVLWMENAKFRRQPSPPDPGRIGQLERMKLNEDKGAHGGGNVNVVFDLLHISGWVKLSQVMGRDTMINLEKAPRV